MGEGEAKSESDEPVLTGAALEAAETQYDKFIWANLKRNYIAHYLHGMLGMTGFRLINAPTFIPVYLHSLSGSDALVGLGLGLQQLGGVISPIVGASKVEHRKRVLPSAMVMGTLMRIPILLMAVTGWFVPGPYALWIFVALLFLLGLFGGAQRVVFQLLLAKMIPISRRGRLQAARNVTGGLIAAVLSLFAGKYLIANNVFGNGYATTFMLAFLLTSAGITIFRLLVREPVPPVLHPATPIVERLKGVRVLIAADRDYRNFLIAQGLAMAGRLATPFYVLHALKVIGAGPELNGEFSFAYLGADTLSNIVWGVLGDRRGFKSNFTIAVVMWIIATLILLFGHGLYMMLAAIFLIGAAQAGYMMSAQSMVLEFGARQDVAMRLAVSTTVEAAVSAIAPVIGGLIATFAGYPPVLALTLVFYGLALATLTFGVTEPRLRCLEREKAVEQAPPGG